MAKKPPERYEPGELERTRRNLGAFSADEAQRLSELLGGEVGDERTEQQVEEQYRRLQDLNRRRTDRILRESSQPTSSEDSEISGAESRSIEDVRPRYRDRVRMDFAAARPEHEIKTLGGAIATLFSPVFATNDYVNPRFIINSDSMFFRHIEDLVTSVRGLLALNRRHPVNRLKTPFYRSILETIKRWDIEGMHSELARLQISPRKLTFRYCGTLAREIFTPIMLMIDIEADYHIRKALKRLYDLDILSLPKAHPDVNRVKHYYHQAAYEAEYIFVQLRQRLCPLLMKLCGTRYVPPERFLEEARDEVLRFLSIDEQMLITLPDVDEAESPEPEPVEADEEVVEPVLEAPKNQKGLEVLERLFPRAGWDRLDEFPDLYPYLEPLFSFPRGFELVPPQDPLQQVYVLISILQEFFYGFRHIKFGVLHQSVGAALPETVQRIIEGWRVLRDEFVARWYLPKLYEYCREVERNPVFAESEYGRRAERDLIWQKKQYLLPYLTVHRGSTPDIAHSIPKLGDLVSELLELLTEIAGEFAVPEHEVVRSVRNPWDRFSFDIESPITTRLKSVMKTYREVPNNANLLLYTYSVLTLLDSLIHDELSFFYPFPAQPVYRTEVPGTATPQYAVPVLDPFAIFREADRSFSSPEPPPRPKQEAPVVDELTGLANEAGFLFRLDREIKRFRERDATFSILAVTTPGYDDYCIVSGEDAGVKRLCALAEVISDEIRDFRDVPARLESAVFAVLLPDTIRHDAVNLAVRLIDRCSALQPEPLPIALGLVEAHKTWSRDRAMRMARKAAQIAATLPSPSISVYDERSNNFRSLSDVGE